MKYEIDEKELESMLGKYGAIKEVHLVRDGEGRSRGFGFVEFEQEDHAEKALEFNGKIVKGRKLFVNYAFDKQSRGRKPRFNNRRGDGQHFGRRNGGERESSKVVDL